MEFVFKYRVRPENLLLLAMANVYRSMAGVVNIVFTLSMILVAFRFWTSVNLYLKILIALGIALFPIFQPIVMYLRSKRIVSRMPDNMEMRIDGKGVTVASSGKSSLLKYSDLTSVTRIQGMLILNTRSKQGFILDRQTLGGKDQELYAFLSKHVGKNTKK